MPERGQTLLNRCGLHPFSVPMLCILDQLIQAHCDHAQNDDAGDDEMKLKNLAAIDNQITKSPPGSQKFPYDDTDKSQADVDLHGAQNRGNGIRQYDFEKYIFFGSAQCIDQCHLLFIHLMKSCIEADNTAKEGYGNAGYDDSTHACAQPDNKERRQSGFGQAVENHQIGLHDFRQAFGIPQESGGKQADDNDQEKAGKGFEQGDADVLKNGIIGQHGQKAGEDSGRTAEKEAVDHVQIRTQFPDSQK